MASKRPRAGEQIALEIRAQAVAHHGNAEPVGDAGQLPGLFLLEELRLVDEHAMNRGVLVMLGDAGIEIVAVAEHLGARFKPDSRGNVAAVALAVVSGHEQHRVHAAFAIVVRRLQQHRRLAGVHGRVVEIELGHGLLLSRSRAGGGGAARAVHRKKIADVADG